MFAQIAHDTLGLVLALRVDDGDLAALGGERVTDALAQPAIAAGDDGNLALQVHLFPPPGRR